ncbi:MAG TPA: hypothetical protein VM657_03005 [Sphingomonas sp.]|nr:hypothetical protein [Sphingomonas sp.]
MSAFSWKAIVLGLAIGLAGTTPATAAPGEQLTDAREQAPEGLIGMWKADIQASTYKGTKPQAAWRSFAYTEDGKVLVSFATRNAGSAISFGHWAAQVDGTPGIEYHSAAGSIPYNVVSWTVVGPGRLHLIVSRHGKTDLDATYQLSPDGKTLTYSYDGTSIVYRRWTMID